MEKKFELADNPIVSLRGLALYTQKIGRGASEDEASRSPKKYPLKRAGLSDTEATRKRDSLKKKMHIRERKRDTL